MMNKLLSLAAGATLLALTGTAYAEQALPASAKKPLALSDRQMDVVTAGSVALGNATALALGEALADTVTQTSTNIAKVSPPGLPSPIGQIVIGQAYSSSLAAGGILFQALAASHADTAASW
jgi:hypothetical protein